MSSSSYNPNITLTSLSTQQGEINLVTNPIAQFDASNWTTSSATLTRSTTGVLSPVIPTGFTASSTTSTTSYVQTSLLNVPATLRNRKLKVQLYIQCADTATWKVDVLKSDGSTRYTLSTDSSGVSALPALTGTYTTTFDMDTGSGIYVRLTRYAGSGTSTLSFTNLIVGPGIQPQGAAVQEWLSTTLTPSAGFGTPANQSYFIKRDGSEAIIRGSFQAGTVTAAVGSISLPSGLTIDTTVLTGSSRGRLGRYEFSSSTLAFISSTDKEGVLFYDGTNADRLAFSLRVNSTGYENTSVSSIMASSSYVMFEARVPIAQWSGSGTVQLAQNDVEYAYNTDVTNTSSVTTSGFANGPTGVAISSNWTTNTSWTRRVRFQTPIQVGDKLQLELNYLGRGWIPFEQMYPRLRQANTFYGSELQPVSGSTTDVDVAFNIGGYEASNASYGGNGTTWNNISSSSWRVRKSSAGAAVGFGIVQPGVSSGLVSASGVPGNTTGNTIASGFVGQIVSNHFGSVNFASAAWANFGSITLTSGLWLVSGSVAGDRNGATLSVFNLAYSIMANGDTSAYSTKYTLRTSTQINVTSSVSWDSFVFSTPSFYVRSDGTNLYFGDGSTLIASSQQLTMYGYIGTFSVATPFAKGKIEAIRIA